jgi:hypothetical protein
VYFTFFDYTIQTTQTAATPVGPVVSYAKYVKDKHWTSVAVADAVDRAAVDRPLAAVPGSERPESTTDEASDGTVDDGDRGRRTRLYRPLNKHLSYDSDYWRTVGAGAEKRADVPGRRSDFPQLAAYRAPFTPKSVVNVMKYVTGSPPHHRAPAGGQGEFMAAQESRYVAIRPAEEVNRFLPDADAPPAGGSKRFRNKFGPPVFLTPPMVAFPDDFMKPPSPGAQFSTDFETAAADVVFHEGSATVPLHTDVVFRHQQPTTSTGYAVPDAPVAEAAVPNKPKNGKAKNKKPISMVVDIYPLADREHEDVEQGQLRPHSFDDIRSYRVPQVPSPVPVIRARYYCLFPSVHRVRKPRRFRTPGPNYSFIVFNGDPDGKVDHRSFLIFRHVLQQLME